MIVLTWGRRKAWERKDGKEISNPKGDRCASAAEAENERPIRYRTEVRLDSERLVTGPEVKVTHG